MDSDNPKVRITEKYVIVEGRVIGATLPIYNGITELYLNTGLHVIDYAGLNVFLKNDQTAIYTDVEFYDHALHTKPTGVIEVDIPEKEYTTLITPTGKAFQYPRKHVKDPDVAQFLDDLTGDIYTYRQLHWHCQGMEILKITLKEGQFG